MSDSDAVKPKLRVGPIADRCGFTKRHVYQLVNDRKIPHYKVGKVLLFDPDEVDAWLEAQKVETAR